MIVHAAVCFLRLWGYLLLLSLFLLVPIGERFLIVLISWMYTRYSRANEPVPVRAAMSCCDWCYRELVFDW
jgi:hypothetical protein